MGRKGDEENHSRHARLSVPAINRIFEAAAWREGYRFIAGVDEVGRGPLAGPVVAAAVILPANAPLPEGLNDSKKLTPARRERLTEIIKNIVEVMGFGSIHSRIVN